MNKNDIKPGMVIELEDDTQLLVTYSDELLTSEGDVWGLFTTFEEDLTHHGNSEYDIRCVWKYKYSVNQPFELIHIEEMPIWEREDEDIDEDMYAALEKEVEELIKQSEKIKKRLEEINNALGLHP